MPFVDGDIVVRQLSDERWEVREPVTYQGARERFVVPAGFTTDFASVPRVFAWLLPRYGRYTKAAILHDWLWSEARHRRFSRSDADGIFRRAMRELGVPFLRRWLMWGAVRWGTVWKSGPGELLRPGFGHLFALLLVSVLAVVYAVVPVAVVLVALVVFWICEVVAFALLKLGGALRPRRAEPKKEVNRPDFLWTLS
jgi:hypothetical protein